MATKTYKAFISYSHRDEKWARWLHKALESYRVPKRLRSRSVPEKLYPVFRDRDELSSAADLSGKVQEALADSESLIVVCSPDAARSRWVNEEIRLFRSLGMADRIFCLIVVGDPQATSIKDACFPPALFDGVADGERHEPLAADARKWADGKDLAKLKLVSGILGIRLDELRRREQRRQRVSRIVWAIAAAAAVALVSIAILSRLAEQARQEHSEALVSQIVEISEDLNTVVDLETLRTIGERLQGYLDTIEPGDLTPESNRQVALVLRQLGQVSMGQGRLDDAMVAFNRSRTILAELAKEFPDNLHYLYESGNAEFYVAGIHRERLEFEAAAEAILRYQDVASKLVAADPGNPVWIMEMSYSHTNLAALKEQNPGTNAGEVLTHMEASVALLQLAMDMDPENQRYQSEYAGALSWLADGQLEVCDLRGALDSRLRSESLARDLQAGSPASLELQRRLAYALTGLARVQRKAGMLEASVSQMAEAKNIFERLVRLDPSNTKYHWEYLLRAAYLADLSSETDGQASVIPEMTSTYDSLKAALGTDQEDNLTKMAQFVQFLIDFADIAERAGDQELSGKLLTEAETALKTRLIEDLNERVIRGQLIQLVSQWKRLNGIEPGMIEHLFEVGNPSDPHERFACDQAILLARQAIIKEDRSSAERHVNYLLGKGYRDPDFIRFCNNYNLCTL